MPRRRIIPVFVPHAGCRHQCVFCDQRQISGAAQPVTPAELTRILDEALPYSGTGAELAFYGGSFTAIDAAAQEALLQAAQPWLADGRLAALRCSTRPDAIDAAVIARLRRYGLTTVELGCQSMDDAVLRASGRGHTARDCADAIRQLKAAGFTVIAQMMTGLPGSTAESDLATGAALAALQPDGVRIYPTVVVDGTPLAELYRRGAYTPQTIEAAAECCAALRERFRTAGITVLRVGLNPTASLDRAVLAGPYHPAFGELVLSRMYLRRARTLLEPFRGSRELTLCVAPRCLSRMIGPGRANLRALEREFSIETLKICPADLEEWQICLQNEGAAGIVDRID